MRFDDVTEGQELPPVAFPLPAYRLVMAAGSNRDFNSIHHNTQYAQATGAPEMYANTLFLLGMWERTVRDWIGTTGTIRAVRGFRMRRFTLVGETPTVTARVTGRRVEDGRGVVTLEVRTSDSTGVTVGPGTVEVELPR